MLVPSVQAQPATKQPVTIFTHGDTILLKEQKDGSLTGPALDLFRCASNKVNYPFIIETAPLSRAGTILSDLDRAVWFPSSYGGNEDRLARSLGPAGHLAINWYLLKDNPKDPRHDSFRQLATVTTYKGSAMEAQLKNEGYAFIEGSADRNRLIYMVLSGQVDALVAIDFRGMLSADTRRKVQDNIRTIPKDSVPVAFQVSIPFHKNDPSFTKSMKKAFDNCRHQ